MKPPRCRNPRFGNPRGVQPCGTVNPLSPRPTPPLRRRAQDVYDDYSPYTPNGTGGVYQVQEFEAHDATPTVLWVPDGGGHNRWREHEVAADQAPGDRKIGF